MQVDLALLEGEYQEDGGRALTMLANHLQRISILVPDEALARLKQIGIWIERSRPRLKAMQYHPSRSWLVEHGHDPRLARKVHITQAQELLSRRQMLKHPAVILHELAHGYHDQFLGFDNPEIIAAYEQAMAAGTYENVLLYTGERVKHYGLSNHKEYFAEGTEAYFYRNDFYPFVRAELRAHDSSNPGSGGFRQEADPDRSLQGGGASLHSRRVSGEFPKRGIAVDREFGFPRIGQRGELQAEGVTAGHGHQAAVTLSHGRAAERIGDHEAVVAVVKPAWAEVVRVSHEGDTGALAVHGARVVAPLGRLSPGVLGGLQSGAAGDDAAVLLGDGRRDARTKPHFLLVAKDQVGVPGMKVGLPDQQPGVGESDQGETI